MTTNAETAETGVDGMTAAERALWFSDARALLNTLEARPDAPLPRTLTIEFMAGLDNAGEVLAHAQVAAAARAMGVEVTIGRCGDYRATYTSGAATYAATAISDAEMQRLNEEMRLGAEAYQALHASQEQEASA